MVFVHRPVLMRKTPSLVVGYWNCMLDLIYRLFFLGNGVVRRATGEELTFCTRSSEHRPTKVVVICDKRTNYSPTEFHPCSDISYTIDYFLSNTTSLPYSLVMCDSVATKRVL